MFDDRYCFCRGGSSFAAHELYNLLLSGIGRKPYLNIVARNEASGIIRVISEREEDPRGIIEILVTPGIPGLPHFHNCSKFEFRITDNKFREAYERGSSPRYQPGVQFEDKVWGVILADVTAAEKKYQEHLDQRFSEEMR